MPPILIGPVLYLVATPIGNLEDISFRAVKVLQQCNAILCEDTRRSSILLQRYSIDKKLISYHKFSESEKLEEIISLLKSGNDLALISDAGTPCINDPGQILVQRCQLENLEYTLIPGPSSPIAALALSGFDSDLFQYVGFIPKESKSFLKNALHFLGTTIALESPLRLIETLQTIQKIDPERKIAVAREMTKTFEECRIGTSQDLLFHYENHPPKGEVVLVIEKSTHFTDDLPLEETIDLLQQIHGLTLKEAIKTAAKIKKIPKKEVYKFVHTS